MERCDVLLGDPDGESVTVTNLTGHPAITLNAGFADGMPRGVMVTGRLYDETAVLSAAAWYEQATAWHSRRPPLR